MEWIKEEDGTQKWMNKECTRHYVLVPASKGNVIFMARNKKESIRLGLFHNIICAKKVAETIEKYIVKE